MSYCVLLGTGEHGALRFRSNDRVAFSAGESKGDFEIRVLGVGGSFFGSGISHVTDKRLLYIPYAVIYIFRPTLSEHLNSAIRQVADESG
jgi:hypothetical protein